MPLSWSRKDLLRTRNFIARRWIDTDKPTFEVRDPADDSLIAQVADSDSEDADAALEAASQALPTWRRTLARDRSQVMKRWHTLILQNQEDVARLISREQGKPLKERHAGRWPMPPAMSNGLPRKRCAPTATSFPRRPMGEA